MTFNVVLLSRAETELADIAVWLSERSPDGAIRWLDAFDAAGNRSLKTHAVVDSPLKTILSKRRFDTSSFERDTANPTEPSSPSSTMKSVFCTFAVHISDYFALTNSERLRAEREALSLLHFLRDQG